MEEASAMSAAGSVITDDPILARFRADLETAYGDRLERAILFGSRARGNSRHDSDYDVAVVLKRMVDRWAESMRLADLSTEVLYQTGAFIHATPLASDALEARTPLMHEIRLEGRDF